ncbi:MAG: protein-tyrosine phosphatase [Crocinitomicaceae bacterium]|jgi:protein-tyrosine phosphatase
MRTFATMKILMVCLGNICRSPVADGLLRKKVHEAGLDVEVDSAGTANYHVGESPDSRMCATAKDLGCPIDDLRARQFIAEDFELFDRIYVMDESNQTNVLSLARTDEDRKKVMLLLNESHPGQNLEVPDPYYGGDQGFIDVFNMLDEATDVIMNQLQNN